MTMTVGDTVKLKPERLKLYKNSCPEDREDNNTAAIQAKLTDIEGGLYMDRDLHGCRWWNEDDVVVVKRADLTNKK